MPEFTPTEWMLDKHRHKSEHEWEVFAECVREAIAKHGNFDLETRSTKHKFAYVEFMNGRGDK